MIEVLVAAGGDLEAPNVRGQSALHVAAAGNKNPEVVGALLNAHRGAGITLEPRNNSGNTPLHLAAATNSNLRVIGTLVSAGLGHRRTQP